MRHQLWILTATLTSELAQLLTFWRNRTDFKSGRVQGDFSGAVQLGQGELWNSEKGGWRIRGEGMGQGKKRDCFSVGKFRYSRICIYIFFFHNFKFRWKESLLNIIHTNIFFSSKKTQYLKKILREEKRIRDGFINLGVLGYRCLQGLFRTYTYRRTV